MTSNLTLIREAAKALSSQNIRETDWSRVAEAHRKASLKAAAARQPVPLHPAPSREACTRCGIPGRKGCDHYLPCEDQPPRITLPEPTDPSRAQQFTRKRRPAKFTGKRQGLSVLRT